MIKVIWHTNKVVTPDNQISTTRNNTTGETYPAEVMTKIRDLAVSFGNSYDDDGNHQGIYFTFFTLDDVEKAINSTLLHGKPKTIIKERNIFFNEGGKVPDEVLRSDV